MLKIKKLIYFYLTFLILVYLFLPFGVKAANFGTVDLIRGQALVTQIQPGVEYGFRLNVSEHPGTGFYFNNITKIDVYKTETSANYSSGSQPFFSQGPYYEKDPDVKANFEKSTMVIVSVNSSATNIQLSATVSYIITCPPNSSCINNGQTGTFNTNPNPYSVSSAIQPTNGTQNNGGLILPTSNGNTTATQQPADTTTGGGISDFIFGPACERDNLISCYAGKITRLFIWIASIGSIFMIIIGGIMLITSAGDPKKVATGRMAITGAIIGLVIVLLSYSIQLFVQKTVTGDGTNNGSNSESIFGAPATIPVPSNSGTPIQPTTGGTSGGQSVANIPMPKLVPSIYISNQLRTNVTEDDTNLLPRDTLYLSVNILNDSDNPTLAKDPDDIFGNKFFITYIVDNDETKSGTTPVAYQLLAPHKTTHNSGINIGTLPAGNHTIKIIIDESQNIAGHNSGELGFSKTFTVASGAAPAIANLAFSGPDKDGYGNTISRIILSKTNGGGNDTTGEWAVGQTAYFRFTIINNGNKAANNFDVQLWKDKSDVYHLSDLQKTWHITSLAPGEKRNFDTAIVLTDAWVQIQGPTVVLDSGNTVQESNETEKDNSDSTYLKIPVR